ALLGVVKGMWGPLLKWRRSGTYRIPPWLSRMMTVTVGAGFLGLRGPPAEKCSASCAAATVAVPRSEATVAAMRVELLIFNLLVSDVRCGRLFQVSRP